MASENTNLNTMKATRIRREGLRSRLFFSPTQLEEKYFRWFLRSDSGQQLGNNDDCCSSPTTILHDNIAFDRTTGRGQFAYVLRSTGPIREGETVLLVASYILNSLSPFTARRSVAQVHLIDTMSP